MLTCSPFLGIINTHPKLPRARVHAAANHEAVTWLEDMQWARHGGVSHGTNKDRHVLCQTAQRERRREHFRAFLELLHTETSDSEHWRQKYLLRELPGLLHMSVSPLFILLTQVQFDQSVQDSCHHVLPTC